VVAQCPWEQMRSLCTCFPSAQYHQPEDRLSLCLANDPTHLVGLGQTAAGIDMRAGGSGCLGCPNQLIQALLHPKRAQQRALCHRTIRHTCFYSTSDQNAETTERKKQNRRTVECAPYRREIHMCGQVAVTGCVQWVSLLVLAKRLHDQSPPLHNRDGNTRGRTIKLSSIIASSP
jgi:hypothetical protein